jgi:transposase
VSTSLVSGRVVIGMDPHKRSATIEVMTADESVLGGGRFATDADGFAEMRRYAEQWPNRVWAIEGCAGIGKHIAVRLLADSEDVVDVPPKLSARTRIFSTAFNAKRRAGWVARDTCVDRYAARCSHRGRLVTDGIPRVPVPV